jgi:hypothetical protein
MQGATGVQTVQGNLLGSSVIKINVGTAWLDSLRSWASRRCPCATAAQQHGHAPSQTYALCSLGPCRTSRQRSAPTTRSSQPATREVSQSRPCVCMSACLQPAPSPARPPTPPSSQRMVAQAKWRRHLASTRYVMLTKLCCPPICQA